MTDSELKDAIKQVNEMVKATAPLSRTYVPLLKHFLALLKEQEKRAMQAVPTWPLM